MFPALVLNYLGQGALILNDPAAIASPFFLLVPDAFDLPLVVLATIATVIASQAVISGAYSVSRQAMQLGLLPRMRVLQTSVTVRGQIFVPVVTLLGDSYLRRMTASHLIPIGLGDLVAKTPDDFVEIAVRLAGDPQRLAELRATLRDRLLASPLMDRPGYARSVDAMFRDLWRRWAGDQPRSAKSTAK